MLRCIFVPNLEIVTSIGGELWHGQAQNGVNFDFEVKFHLEGQGQPPPKTIGILTKVFFLHLWSKFGYPSLNGWWVIAWTSSWLTHGRTHRQTQVTTIPEGQNWPRVETAMLRVTGLCGGNSPVIGEFPTQRASDAENVSIWWRHHAHAQLNTPYIL